MLTSPLRYDNVADANRRLAETIVLIDDKPVYVVNTESDLKINYFDPRVDDSVSTKKIHSSDTRINLESPKLGWTNTVGKGNKPRPIYYFRTVHRQYSQGIVPASLQGFDPKRPDIIQGYYWRTWLGMSPLLNMIENIGYPSILAAADEPNGCAFDKDWAFVPSKSKGILTVFHEFQPVGFFARPKHSFLFNAGKLTKTRLSSLNKIFNRADNRSTFFNVEERTKNGNL